MLLAIVCVAVGATAAAGTAAPYNPDHLAAAQISRVEGLCQNVLGLSPSERPSEGIWPGGLHLPRVVSHYQACIVSLSDSLQRAQRQPGGNVPAPSSDAASGGARTTSIAVGSFFYASGHEIVRREQQACEQLGLQPPLAPFASCVRNLQTTFFAIDNPID